MTRTAVRARVGVGACWVLFASAVCAPAGLATGRLAGASAGPPPAEIEPEDAAAIELRLPARSPWVGETFGLELFISVDDRFFAERAIPLVRRPLDLPVLVGADWLDGLDGLLESLEAPPAVGPRLVVGDAVVRAEPVGTRTVDGRARTEHRVVRPFRAVGPGRIELSAPRLRFGWATRFAESLLGGREPEDRFETVIEAESRVLTVLPLPSEGRPADFTGAVGALDVRADAAPRDVALGEAFELTLVLRGAAAGAVGEAPRFDGGGDFRSLGWRTEREGGEVRFVWSLEPLREGALVVVAPRAPWFDPDAGRYRAGASAPIPMVVRAGAEPVEQDGGGAAVGIGDDLDAGDAVADGAEARPESHERTSDDPRGLAPLVAAVGAALLAVALVVGRGRRRARRAARVDARTPDGVDRLRAAAPEFERALDVPDADLAGALTALLAAALDRDAAAVVDRDLARHLTVVGIDERSARGLATLHDELVAARFGGAAPFDAAARARALVSDACGR